MSLARDEESLFGFEHGDWLERMRAAESSGPLGQLGPYRLLEEVGRGGQGVVFRAIQPGTGRTIAVKRLLGGSFASPSSLRRFQREAEAAAALVHPGIVTVHGVEFVDGSPLLAMEWVDGVPLTDWARARPRTEVLHAYLQVCEAVQHAHQRGVLHRDLKPANVLVDVSGRPRLLDFGLAKLPEGGGSALTESGGFLGTPAYAAPEQLRGEPSDARTDIHALGALLFELLTGRRAIEGEGLEAVARAASVGPPRPSSVERSIPRDLDAIVLQAMASDPAHRYQSVDALSADLRRFLEGRPVLAHGPSAAYLLRKFVVRNRVASAAVLLLLGATVVFGLASVRQARRLKVERDRALAASERETDARRQAEADRTLAEQRQKEAERARAQAQAAQAEASAILTFLVDDVIAAADPEVNGPMPELVKILEAASQTASARFAGAPAIEARVRSNLARSFLSLGAWSQAEREVRRALAYHERAGDDQAEERAACGVLLGQVLVHTGGFEEARSRLEAGVAWFEERPAPAARSLKEALLGLVALAGATGRYADGLAPLERLEALESEPSQRLLHAAERVRLLVQMEAFEDAGAMGEALLPELVRVLGADSVAAALLELDLACCRQAAHDDMGSDDLAARSLATLATAFGAEHPRLAEVLARLAASRSRAGRFREALPFAMRGLSILRAAGSDGPDLVDLLIQIGLVHLQLGRRSGAPADFEPAVAALEEALPRCARIYSRDDSYWALCVRGLHEALTALERHAQAEALLDEAEHLGPANAPWLLGAQAMQLEHRGDDEGAASLYERAVTALAADPQDNWFLMSTLRRFAALLRRLGDTEGARPLEERAEAILRAR